MAYWPNPAWASYASMSALSTGPALRPGIELISP